MTRNNFIGRSISEGLLDWDEQLEGFSLQLLSDEYSNSLASKAGVEAFTRTVAREVAKHQIRCNAVMPGFIDTPIVETVPQKSLYFMDSINILVTNDCLE